MPLVEGRVNECLEALVTVRIIGGLGGDVEVECVVDTAFNGSLVLPREVIERLGLPILFHEKVGMVGGEETSADYTLAQIEWLGVVRRVDIIVKEDRLLGNELLAGTQLIIDYVGRTLRIER